jgi:hypothetical protein
MAARWKHHRFYDPKTRIPAHYAQRREIAGVSADFRIQTVATGRSQTPEAVLIFATYRLPHRAFAHLYLRADGTLAEQTYKHERGGVSMGQFGTIAAAKKAVRAWAKSTDPWATYRVLKQGRWVRAIPAPPRKNSRAPLSLRHAEQLVAETNGWARGRYGMTPRLQRFAKKYVPAAISDDPYHDPGVWAGEIYDTIVRLQPGAQDYVDNVLRGPWSGTRRNGRKRRNGMEIQTLLFPKHLFTVRSAVSWAKKNGFKAAKVDTGSASSRYLRIRQHAPSSFARLRTMQLGDNVKAVAGTKARENGRKHWKGADWRSVHTLTHKELRRDFLHAETDGNARRAVAAMVEMAQRAQTRGWHPRGGLSGASKPEILRAFQHHVLR